MGYIQAITPDPHIPCKPGWCLQYVRQAFDLPARYGTATEAWEKSTTQHRDRNYPTGVWFAVWWHLDKNAAGHVALVTPDGSVYSTSSLKNTPYHHPNIAHVEAYYARYGMTLTYRGWTEDVAGFKVIEEEDDMAYSEEDLKRIIAEVVEPMHVVTRKDTATNVLDRKVPYTNPVTGKPDGTTTLATMTGNADFQHTQTRLNTDAKTYASNVPDDMVEEVVNLLAKRMAN